jgi:hypothetical protein
MHWKIPQGKIEVLCNLPIPLIEPSIKALVTNLPSGRVQVP